MHHAVTVGDHFEEVPDGRRPQAILMKRRRRRKSAAYDHSVSFAGAAMTGRTIDFESLAASPKKIHCERNRKRGSEISSDLAGVKRFVQFQLPARNRVQRDRARSAAVGKKITGLERVRLRLHKHIAATSNREEGQKDERSIDCVASHENASPTFKGRRRDRKARVCVK